MLGRIATMDRLKAAAIDGTIMGAVILGTAFAPSLYNKALVFSSTGALIGAFLAELFSLSDLTRNGTPGKVILKLRIGSANRKEATDDQLVRRWAMKHMPLHATLAAALYAWMDSIPAVDAAAVYITGAIAVLVGLAGVLFAAGYVLMFDTLYQALHDVLTNTCVYDASITEHQQVGFQVLKPGDAPPGQPFASPTPILRPANPARTETD